MRSLDELRLVQSRHRAVADASELARAEQELADIERDRAARNCECEGARYVRIRTAPGALPVAIPCHCIPLPDRAAMAGIPREFRSLTLETFPDLPGKRAAVAAAKAWDGGSGGIIFASPPTGSETWGTGKTGLGCALLLRSLAANGAAKFIFTPDFLAEIRSRFDHEEGREGAKFYIDHIASQPLLMLDDLGAEKSTPWTMEQLRLLLDRRWRDGLPTIVTTNCSSLGAIAEAYGGAVASRLSAWQWVAVAGVDMRAAVAEAVSA